MGERSKSVTGRVWFWRISGGRVEDLSVAYRPGVANPAPDPNTKRTTKKKSAPSKSRKPARCTRVSSLLGSSSADDAGPGEGLGAPSIDAADEDRPVPTCRMGALCNIMMRLHFARLKST